jgi:hypothetical protein
MNIREPANIFTAYVEYMKLMLGNLFLINGGSAVALLAFLGNTKPSGAGDPIVQPAAAREAIVLFAMGAAGAIVATASAAILENRNAALLERGKNLQTWLGFVSFAFIALSICCFVMACVVASNVKMFCL